MMMSTAKVFQRWIEHFLDHAIQSVNLIDEEHIASFEICQDRNQIASALDRRTGGHAQADRHLGGDDRSQRRLAQTRRAIEQRVIERLAAALGGLDENGQARLDPVLADVLGQTLRAQRTIDPLVLVSLASGNDTLSRIRIGE